MITILSRFFSTRPKLLCSYGWLNYGWRFFCAVLFLNLSLTAATFAQNKVWDKTFGGDNDDQLQIVRQTRDGGYILGGTSLSGKSGDKTQASKSLEDYWVVKLKADGTKEWDKTFGGSSIDNLRSLQQTSDGGFILGGSSYSGKSDDKLHNTKGGLDYWVIKLKADGTKVWDKTLGGDRNDGLTSLQQTSEGDYILGGYSESGISGDKTEDNIADKNYYPYYSKDYWVIKLKADGTKIWDKTLGGEQDDELSSVQQTIDGGYLLGGTSSSYSSGDKTEQSKGFKDYWVVKLKADGSKEWDKTIGGDNYNILTSAQQTSDGGFILAGYSDSNISGDKTQEAKESYDYWIVKLQANGTKVWDKTIGGTDYDELTALQPTTDGGFILGGYSNSGLSGDKSEKSKGGKDEYDRPTTDFWLVKIKSDGNIAWDKTIGGNLNERLTSLQQIRDGSYILGGYSDSNKSGDKSTNSKGSNDYWVVKLDNRGTNLNQTITFKPIAEKVITDAPFTLSATAVSGLPVTFSVVSGPATIKGNILTLTGLPGTVTVKATQAGNNSYKPAPEVKQTFVVQTIRRQWNKTFGGTEADDLTAMVATPDGGYLLGGTSASNKSGNKSQASKGQEDYWIVKTDKEGKKLWDKSYGGSGADYLTTMVATNDGGYLLGGFSNSGRNGDKSQASRGKADYWLVKIDGSGNKLWDKSFGGSSSDNLRALLVSSDGGYLVGGSSSSHKSGDKSQASKGKSDYWLVKLDATGNKLWDKTYGGSNTDNLAALITTSNGGYLLGGTSASGISGDKSQATRAVEDYWVVRINANGVKIWDKTFGGSRDSYLDEYCEPEDGNNCTVYFGSSELSALVATPDGGFLLGGSSNAAKGAEKSKDNLANQKYGGDQYLNDYWVVKIDNAGNKIWDQTLGGVVVSHIHEVRDDLIYMGNSRLQSIVITPDGHYLLAGTSDSDKGRDKSENSKHDYEYATDRSDYWTVKIDGNGNKLWDKTIGGLSNDYLAVILPVAIDEYILAGSSISGIGGHKSGAGWNTSEYYEERLEDYWIVKIKDETPASFAWNMRYGGTGTDGLTTVIKTSDGGYLSGGYSTSSNNGDKTQSSQGKNDYWIVKSDKNGKKIWDKRYGGSQDDYLYSVVQTPDGGYLLGGSSLSELSGDKTQAGRGSRDYWIVKISSTGVKQWDKRFGGSGSDDFRRIVSLANGDFVLAGNSSSPAGGDKTQGSQGGQDYWLVKINKTGTKIWDKRYGGSLNENLEGLAITLDGGYLLGGTSLSGQNGDKTQLSRGGNDFWLVRVDKNGNKVWDKRFGGSGEDYLTALGSTGTSTGNFFLAGYSTSGKNGDKSQTSQGGQDFWMLKMNGNGSKLWDKRFGGSSSDVLRSIILTTDGGYLLGGASASGSNGDKTQDSRGSSDYWIVKTSSTGVKQWDKRFGGSGYDEIRTVMQTADNGYLLGGRSASGTNGDKTQPSQGGTDFWLVKVAPQTSPVVAVREAAEAAEPVVKAGEVNLLAYPNPFQDKLRISFTLPESQPASVKVYDSQGREAAILFQQEAQANQTYQLEWPAGNKASGLYILQLQTPTKRQQLKLLLAK